MFVPIESGHIGIVGWYFIGLLVFLSYASFRSRKRIADMKVLPTRTAHFTSTLLLLTGLWVIALLVARKGWIALYPRLVPTPLQIGVGLVTALALAAAMKPMWRRSVARGDRRLYLFTPQTAVEKTLWICVSLMAGFAEETIYRGVLYVLFLTVTPVWAAALLSALIFAGNHAVQSRTSMIIIFFFALLFQALALWTGSLYVPMLTHFVYDVIAGLTYSRLAKEMGYRAEGDPSAPAAVPPAAPAAG